MLKRMLPAVCLCVAVFLWAAPGVATVRDDGHVNPSQGERIPGVLVIQLAEGYMPFGNKLQSNGATMGVPAVDQLNVKHGMSDYYPLFPRGSASAKSVAAGQSPMDRWHLLYFDPSADLDKLAAEYEALPEVERVDFDYFAYIMRTPDDALYPQMFQLNQGSDRDMDAPEAWEKTVGSPDIILADTDTGVLWSHEDLNANVWINPGEDLDGDRVVMDPSDMNGIDDDGNGYVDDLIGWDFVTSGSLVWPGEDGAIQDNDPNDFNGHGTHTSGTIAATTNNTVGVSGVAGGFGVSEPGCRIMCLRMGYSFDDGGQENGRTHMSYVAQAFTYAYRNGATAINYSFGSSTGGGIEAATDSAVAHELVISAAAGNDNGGVTGYLQNRTDVLCVASTTSNDTRSSFSNYGPQVDVAAPGSSIYSTVSNHYSPTYARFSGTSMAAPQVVGQVGLIRSLNPSLTRQDVFDIIIGTADNIDALNPAYVGMLGSGRINLNNSLQNLASTNFAADPRVGPAPLYVQFYDSSFTPPTGWTWYFGDGDSALIQNPSHVYGPGLWDVTLRTQTALGTGLKQKVSYIAALAETLAAVDTVAPAGTVVAVDVWATNFQPVKEIILPLRATNIPGSATLDSMVTTGCRTDYFEYKQLVYDARTTGAVCMRMRADNNQNGSPAPLAPGAGPIARLWFKMKSNVNPANFITVDTATLGISQLQLKFSSPVLDFVPTYNAGMVNLFVLPGDIDYDGAHTVIDVTLAVDHLFRSVPLPTPPDRVDANCDGEYNILDVIKVVEFAFRAGVPQPCP
ncbi:MAG TPA: S8 family serine peptidase [bacterium]|nr:S8 family serine peptidase [bacterium]